MIGTKDDRPAGKSGLRGFTGTILVALVLGAILCADPVLAQTLPAQDAVPAAAPPPAAGAAGATPDAATAAAPAAPPAEESNPSPRITDALLPSALPRDLSPWGMFLSAVPIVKASLWGLLLRRWRPGRSGSRPWMVFSTKRNRSSATRGSSSQTVTVAVT